MIKWNVIHIRNLMQALNHGLVLKKVRRLIKFNWNAWLKTIRTHISDKSKR